MVLDLYREEARRENLLPAISTVLLFYRRALITAIHSWTGIPSSLLIVVICGVAFILFLAWAFMQGRIVIKPPVMLLAAMGILYGISLSFAPNENGQEFAKEFLSYCVPTAFIFSYVEDEEQFTRVYCRLSLFVFAICAPIPFLSGTLKYLDMGYFASGMTYGEWVMTPCFVGLYLLYKRYGKAWVMPLWVICLGITALYANRSSLLSNLCFMALYELFVEGRREKKVIFKWIFILVAVMMMITYLADILVFLQDQILTPAGFRSRALRKYIAMLQTDSAEVNASYLLSGRDKANARAMEFFLESPIFGIGVGTYGIRTTLPYTHNIVTDAVTTFGLPAGLLILFVTGAAIVRCFRCGYEPRKVALFTILIQCFPRLLFSKTFVNDVAFWMLLVYAFIQKEDEDDEPDELTELIK